MKTAVIILNWNTKDYLKAFLPSLLQSCKGTDACVVVADSGSDDGSVKMLSEEFPDVKVIALGKNYGYTGGYNRAIAAMEKEGPLPDYLVLLNSDILVDDAWLGPLTAWLDSHPECGICGPKLHALDPDGKGGWIKTSRFEYAGAAGGLLDCIGLPYCRGRILRKVEEDKGQYDGDPCNVLWVTGSCLMIRSSLWDALGGLDGRFFAHQEEIDLCWRAQLAGFKVTVLPQSCVWHLGGGTLPQGSPLKLKLNYRNNLMLLEKNLPTTLEARGLSPVRAHKKTFRLLRLRLFLHNCAKIFYLCSGKKEYAQAVLDAHSEWRELRMKAFQMPETAPGARVEGLGKKCILL